MAPTNKAPISTNEIEAKILSSTDISLLESHYFNVYNELQEEIEKFQYIHLTRKQRMADIKSVRTEPKIMRNQLCPCESGKKYKNCCINKK
jgi:uncharacterized protein YecA (UPF0149 family)